MTSILNKARENHLSLKPRHRAGGRSDAAALDAAEKAWRLIIENVDNCLTLGDLVPRRQSGERLMERFPAAMAGEEA